MDEPREPAVPPDARDEVKQKYLQALGHLNATVQVYKAYRTVGDHTEAWVATAGHLTESTGGLSPEAMVAHLADVVAAACARLADASTPPGWISRR